MATIIDNKNDKALSEKDMEIMKESRNFELKWKEPFEKLMKQGLDVLTVIYENIEKLSEKTYQTSVDMKKLRVCCVFFLWTFFFKGGSQKFKRTKIASS
jgi:hypothetical protein